MNNKNIELIKAYIDKLQQIVNKNIEINEEHPELKGKELIKKLQEMYNEMSPLRKQAIKDLIEACNFETTTEDLQVFILRDYDPKYDSDLIYKNMLELKNVLEHNEIISFFNYCVNDAFDKIIFQFFQRGMKCIARDIIYQIERGEDYPDYEEFYEDEY